MNLAAVAGLGARSIAGVWYRAVDPKYLAAALGYSHARRSASRYYEGPTAALPFDIVYWAENPLVALFEVEALFGSPLTQGGLTANPARSWLDDGPGTYRRLEGLPATQRPRALPRRLAPHPHKRSARPFTLTDYAKDFLRYPPKCRGKWCLPSSLDA